MSRLKSKANQSEISSFLRKQESRFSFLHFDFSFFVGDGNLHSCHVERGRDIWPAKLHFYTPKNKVNG
ncbi:MAG: hypothetical protein RQ760_03780, partial [Sedimentisphaerales bacterium]|nr:hypothetical protein [Sedimentisphaerales bacterium]